MTALGIIGLIVGIIIYVITGIICGRICVEIVRNKNSEMNEVLWFWAGFFLGCIGVFMTLTVKDVKNK